MDDEPEPVQVIKEMVKAVDSDVAQCATPPDECSEDVENGRMRVVANWKKLPPAKQAKAEAKLKELGYGGYQEAKMLTDPVDLDAAAGAILGA